ncbi:hypothetical protein WICPIJ_008448 [Wickerhamomyces pijperi]|uniref:Uncharacterized protein n=1 Tax=Wickerhamomyces pijperi TaxID=599730 RepID=A0A9P8TIM1_WICPI|nr:hypothetical protein WICPIJ_008448 [Wickerhamomyces pijperi]
MFSPWFNSENTAFKPPDGAAEAVEAGVISSNKLAGGGGGGGGGGPPAAGAEIEEPADVLFGSSLIFFKFSSKLPWILSATAKVNPVVCHCLAYNFKPSKIFKNNLTQSTCLSSFSLNCFKTLLVQKVAESLISVT